MPTSLSPAQQARNRLGAAARRHDPPEVIARLRRELEAANLTEAIAAARRRVATWPTFTEAQISRVDAQLRGGSDEQAT